ncbi:hypothetical protein T03_8985 [Trichinella britovi]|uniref:Uncharacterized protein n=1 Tax=Trichinella britovi TaxID=45882 RepID=A0A0V1CY55_TRIBR|nr:hypothetical protein T03_8985 [Trichinella britovi]
MQSLRCTLPPQHASLLSKGEYDLRPSSINSEVYKSSLNFNNFIIVESPSLQTIQQPFRVVYTNVNPFPNHPVLYFRAPTFHYLSRALYLPVILQNPFGVLYPLSVHPTSIHTDAPSYHSVIVVHLTHNLQYQFTVVQLLTTFPTHSESTIPAA